ncbi:MAG: DUF4097 family beta strand repeat-containing protein [Pseudonocardiaceae bacterium]
MEHDDTDASAVRQQDFECQGPIDISVELDSGRLDITLEDGPEEGTAGPEVVVQIRPDPTSQPPWAVGIGGLLNWLGEQTGATPPGALAAEAVRRTVIDFTGQRLTVRTPRELPLRTVPLIIQVSAPPGSSINARSGSADVAVTGMAAALDAATGSGDVRLGTVSGHLRVRTGSGEVDVISVEGTQGSGTVQTGSGDVRLGAVARDVSARTGSGDLTVVDASAGGLELTTGSGQLRVGIHGGVLAELDVSSGSGRAHSDLPVGGPPAEGEVALRVRARTGSGDALVTAAPS